MPIIYDPPLSAPLLSGTPLVSGNAINVVIANVWITDVATMVSINAATPARDMDAALSGRVGIYAGGRRRVITAEGDVINHPLALNWVTGPDTTTLMSWRGHVLLLRDALGRRVFGTILAMSHSAVSQGSEYWNNVSFTFQELDYDESA